MIRFLVIYCSLYLLMHSYAYYTLHRGLAPGKVVRFTFFLWSLLMIGGPIIIRVAERAGMEIGARSFAFLCFSWMGLLFLFLAFSLLLDCLRLLVLALRPVFTGCKPFFLMTDALQVKMLLIVTVSVFLYGLYEAEAIRIVHHRITSPKIAESIGPIRVVQISDVHLGLLTKERKLGKILEKVREARPDILVSTGDLVDGQLNNISGLADLLSAVHARFGKFAVLGNHEVYAGLDHSIRFTKDAGFTLLRNSGVELEGFGLTIIGVDDRAVSSRTDAPEVNEKKMLQSFDSGMFRLLLKHRPEEGLFGANLFDLQLSGHTHKGQIFPFNLITWIPFPFPAGKMVEESDGARLYVNPGSGTWGPPIRVLAPPEVTVIDLVHGE